MDKSYIRQLEKEIPELHGNISIDEITKGYSPERKFMVRSRDHSKNILRTTQIKNFERKKTEYDLLQRLRKTKVKCPMPIAVGLSQSLEIAYLLITYIDGYDAKEALPLITEKEQYHAGLEAGKELHKINDLRAPSAVEPWYMRKQKKYYLYLNKYKKNFIKVKGEYKIISFIEHNMQLMDNSPNYLQHDDFHVGNIIMKNKRYAGIIDFNRYDWGDPIHEFYKVAWFSSEISIPFSIGQIQGYYNNRVPKNFWQLYSLYVAMSIFPTVVWFQTAQPNRIDYMKNRTNVILEDHKYFELLKPKWYNV